MGADAGLHADAGAGDIRTGAGGADAACGGEGH